VLDFFCHEAALAVEVDGGAHDIAERALSDERRDALLAADGIATLRVLAEDVRTNLDGVVEHIVAMARDRLTR
jgi:very-short-patch-repair endonuclease